MKLSDISAWLASARDFAQGAALYATLGPSATYKRLFALGATEYASEVLTRELASLVEEVQVELAVVSQAVPTPALEPPADSPLLTHLRQELKAVRDLRSHVHPQLTAKGMRRTERQQIARTIVALTDKEVEFLATIAYVQVHGRLPGPVPTAQVTDPGELRRRLQNARSLRSKLRDNPERAADFAELEKEISLLISKLKPLTNG